MKRGLASDLVVSPYSTIMTLGLDAPRAVANMRALEQEGALGELGYYDAIDYTPDRLAIERPIDGESRIAPEHAALVVGRVVIGRLVEEFGGLREGQETVGEARGNPELLLVLRAEYLADPWAERF